MRVLINLAIEMGKKIKKKDKKMSQRFCEIIRAGQSQLDHHNIYKFIKLRQQDASLNSIIQHPMP